MLASARSVFPRMQCDFKKMVPHNVPHRSAGKKQEFEGETYTIEELTENRCACRGCHMGMVQAEDLAAPMNDQQSLVIMHAV